MLPEPWQLVHVDEKITLPFLAVFIPVPLQAEHVVRPLPFFSPVPLQNWHDSTLS